MAHIIEDRVLESTTTTGSGALVLAGAVVGFRRFSAVCGVGDTAPYFIEAIDSLGVPTGDYEYGIGTYSAANQLTRTTVTGSSNGGAAVNFVAGSKNVGLTLSATDYSATKAAIVPTGAVFHFPANVAPTGYVKANGALLSRATYAALYAYALASGNIAASDAAWTGGSLFGQFSPGDGATTFRVPNLCGEFIRGWDDGRGVDSGRAIGTSQADTVGPHTHPSAVTGTASGGGFSSFTTTGSAFNVSANTGTTETRPRNVALLACIKT